MNKKMLVIFLLQVFILGGAAAYSADGPIGAVYVNQSTSAPEVSNVAAQVKNNISEKSQSLSLNSLIQEALKNNPQITSARWRYEAAKARISLPRTVEDPRFEYEYDKITADMDAVLRGKTGPMRTFAISQSIPFPTKLFLRKKAAQKEADSYRQEYIETGRKVIKDVKEAYFRLFLSSKKITITRENLNLLGRFAETVNTRYSVGKANQQDALKAQVESSKLSNQLVLLEQEEKIYETLLNSLLSRPPNGPLGLLQEKNSKAMEFEEEGILKLTKDSRPELKSYRDMLKKSAIELELAKQEYLPDFMLKYRREERNGSAGPWAGMVGVTIPLWFLDKQNSFVREARANLEEAKAQYQAEENVVLFEARSSYVKFEAAKNLVKIYETGILPQAQAALETATLGYQSDKIGFLDLLDTLRTLWDFQMEYLESLANLEIALADLERSVGIDITQYQTGRT